MFTTAPVGQQHLNKVLSLTSRSTLCKQMLSSCPGFNRILPKTSQGNTSLPVRPGVSSQVKGHMWSWDGLVLLMEGRRHGRPDGITDVLWLKVDPCPTRVLPYLVIVAKQRKQCQQTGILHLSCSCFISDCSRHIS